MTTENQGQEAPKVDGRSREARAAAQAQAEATTDAVPKSQRRRRASTGGFSLKLDAPVREGFVRRFVNDDPGRVQKMRDLGYDFVTEKAGEGETRTDAEGTRIARFAGKTEEGAPFRTYLMETPATEYNFGISDKEEARKPFEEAIRRSVDTTGGLAQDEFYQPGQSTIRHSG